MHLRRTLLAHTWAQLGLVLIIVALVNTWSARSFVRLDLTADRLYSLDLVSRAMMTRLEKPLLVKVYFTGGLQAPYNNHEQIVTDKLDDLRAYSGGLMEIDRVDPTSVKELEAEAARFGIQSIQYRYQDANVTEMKRVFMGVALIYGDKQEVLPAITQVETLEYDLVRAIKALVSDEERRTVGWSTGHSEPNLLGGRGPLERIRSRMSEDYDIATVELGGEGGVPDEIDALYVVGPQRPLPDRALYQLDQFLMRGGALAIFLSNTRPDLRSLRPQSIYHGLEPLLGHYGVRVNRDVVVDRKSRGKMPFPVRQGRYVVRMNVDYPLIPRATELDADSPVVRGLDTMLFPFVSSLTLADPLPPDVEATVLAASSPASGTIKGIRTVDPNAYKIVAPGEQRGSFPLLVSLTGAWRSYFADGEIPAAPAQTPMGGAIPDDPATRLRESAQTRLVVAGSADFVANNIAFMLNLTDWLVQDESLIGIRSKAVQIPPLDPIEPQRARLLKVLNLLAGPLALFAFGGLRWLVRRRRDS